MTDANQVTSDQLESVRMHRTSVSERARKCMQALAAKLWLAVCDEKLQMLPAF